MHDWRLPPGKILLSFKTMKNIKTADVLKMNSFTAKVIFYKKKRLRYHPKGKIHKNFSSATMAS